MTSTPLYPAVLRGGRADGRVVDVPLTRRVVVVEVGSAPHTYPAGVLGVDETKVERVEIETYRRVDDETFEPYWTATSIGDDVDFDARWTAGERP